MYISKVSFFFVCVNESQINTCLIALSDNCREVWRELVTSQPVAHYLWLLDTAGSFYCCIISVGGISGQWGIFTDIWNGYWCYRYHSKVFYDSVTYPLKMEFKKSCCFISSYYMLIMRYHEQDKTNRISISSITPSFPRLSGKKNICVFLLSEIVLFYLYF